MTSRVEGITPKGISDSAATGAHAWAAQDRIGRSRSRQLQLESLRLIDRDNRQRRQAWPGDEMRLVGEARRTSCHSLRPAYLHPHRHRQDQLGMCSRRFTSHRSPHGVFDAQRSLAHLWVVHP